MRRILILLFSGCFLAFFLASIVHGQAMAFKENIFDPGILKPTDSQLKVKVGDRSPNFTLPSVAGEPVIHAPPNRLSPVVPAAWTPVCSDQWPGYNMVQELFDQNDAVLLGITVDNIPTLFAWTNQMGKLWFSVLSDFWPHGAVAQSYGVLRSDGVSERALFLIDKKGIIRYINVNDINKRPPLEDLVKALKKLP